MLDLKKDANLTANPAQLKGVLELSGGRAFEIAARPGKVQRMSTRTAPQRSRPTQLCPAQPVATPAISPSPRHSSLRDLLTHFGVGFSRRAAAEPDAVRVSGAVSEGAGAGAAPGNEERHKLRAHGFVYAAGILVSFWALVAVLLGLRAAGATLGWGFQFQSPVFLALMAGLLFFLGLSLAGQFEIGLTLTSAGGSLAAKQGYAGSFFTGVLAVVVATPCTAPFMGAAIGYALAQPAAVTFAVFTALALGLAAPYVALTLQPAWTRLLPQARRVDGGAEAGHLGAHLRHRDLAGVGAGAGLRRERCWLRCWRAFCCWRLRVGSWAAGRPSAGRRLLRRSFCWRVVAFSVLAPGEAGGCAGDLDRRRRSRRTGSHGRADAVSRYQAQGRPVFVDFTASWCLSCQVNERVALSQPEVQKAFADAHVALLRADWTQHDEAITQALAALDRSGVPAYALYTPGQSSPQLLPEVLTPGIVTDALAKLPKTAN